MGQPSVLLGQRVHGDRGRPEDGVPKVPRGSPRARLPRGRGRRIRLWGRLRGHPEARVPRGHPRVHECGGEERVQRPRPVSLERAAVRPLAARLPQAKGRDVEHRGGRWEIGGGNAVQVPDGLFRRRHPRFFRPRRRASRAVQRGHQGRAGGARQLGGSADRAGLPGSRRHEVHRPAVAEGAGELLQGSGNSRDLRRDFRGALPLWLRVRQGSPGDRSGHRVLRQTPHGRRGPPRSDPGRRGRLRLLPGRFQDECLAPRAQLHRPPHRLLRR
mmetsp:Transcript_9357/g.26608  ORF Transcript_9357/g.26608 Transcript_9357/m.26608 type:complete len:272 (+) Transcript_9357:1243-2058(+)